MRSRCVECELDAVVKPGRFSCFISYYFSGPRIIDFLFIGLPMANPEGDAQSRNEK